MSRRGLPSRRRCWTQKAVVGDGRDGVKPMTCFLTCGEYDDGTLGEIFLVVAKQGTALRAALDAFAVNFSIALQNGTPLDELVASHRGTDFLPQGQVKHDDSGSEVSQATSIIDWAMQEVENAYLKPREVEEETVGLTSRPSARLPEKVAGRRTAGSGC
jgi:ribonucleoside-diphosphate reductase alpha chain